MGFLESLELNTSGTYTENGQYAKTTTANYLLDLYGTIGALRDAEDDRKTKLFDRAMSIDKLLTAKILFHSRDIREGIGERQTFRTLLRYAADRYPEIVIPNLPLVGFYGRFDDLYCLIGTKCEAEMWETMGTQLAKDLENMKAGKPVSLLAKWIKTPDASSEKTRALGILTSQKLGYLNVGAFKKDLKPLRKYLKIVEIDVSANSFETIAYDKVPSNAMMKYRNLFLKKDGDRFQKYIDDVAAGKVSINSGVLYPYDFVRKVFRGEFDDTLEVMWKNLPNYVEDGTNVLVMADVSGSMTCCDLLPLSSSIGLAIYFAERAQGVFHNKFLTFSAEPELQTVAGATLYDKIQNMNTGYCCMNTDLMKAMRAILQAAKDSNAKQEEIPKALVIISDMEIDECITSNYSSYRARNNDSLVSNNKMFYEICTKEFNDAGYTLPNVIFWNVNSRHDVFHATSDVPGVQYLSGHSITSFKQLMNGIDKTPVEAMMEVLLSERYEPITVAE